jgi:tRNA nucleotidyltransferase (CCA-adding enzyme)
MNTVCNCPKDYVLRFAALFHDLGKPLCKTTDSRGDHFHGHPRVSKDIAEDIMTRWKFSSKDKMKISNLVLEHDTLGYKVGKNWNFELKKLLFKYDDNFVSDLLLLSEADMKAHSAFAISKKAPILEDIKKEYRKICDNHEPYKIKDLVINGNDVMDLGFQGKMVGNVLTCTLLDVMKYPEHNNKDYILDEDTIGRYVRYLRSKMNMESTNNNNSIDLVKDLESNEEIFYE